jgi:DeoR family transcriptional regulator, fructose operon transcriptional repressor
VLIVERQQRVLEILRQQHAAQLEALADAVGVSVSTVRRDLETLEQRGLVRRTHGGAVLEGPTTNGGTVSMLADRMRENIEAKQAIGAFAASLVQPHMTVLLDGGSTVLYAARQITARPLQVVTNSLPIAALFADDDQVELLVIGGNLYPRSGVLVGPIATGCLADLHANLMLFSLAGIIGDEAFNQNMAMAQVEQAMLRQSSQSVMLMDSSKFGRKSLTRVCALGEVDHIVTDSAVKPQWPPHLGSRLIIAPSLARP